MDDRVEAAEIGVGEVSSESPVVFSPTPHENTNEENAPKLFTDNELIEFEAKGYEVFELKGEVLPEEDIDKYITPYFKSDVIDLIKKQQTIKGHVAIPPNVFLPNCEDTTFDEASKLLGEQNQEIEAKFPTATLRMGEIVDIIMIEELYKTKHGRSLFEDNYVRSRTFIDRNRNKFAKEDRRSLEDKKDDQRNLVFIPSAGLVDAWHGDATVPMLKSVGLIVPK
ncbi:MAG: hypothetical protein Q7T54_05695 [Candidatus Levybacteria bacterium]|nr:hypothetical protein [Candidatus Levybacteria bacterium]